MNELLKINTDNEQITLSARELHEFLGVSTKFQDWFKRMCEYGFDDGVDFNMLKIENVLSQKRERTYSTSDYQITIDMAKEIAMLQRNEKGKEARQYFIQIEKQWNSPEYVMKRALEFANKKVESLMLENKELKPKANFADAVSSSDISILVGELSKLLKQNGVDIGQNRLFEWLRNNGYLMKMGEQKNLPTQMAMNQGLFEIKERTVSYPDGTVRVLRTPKVTGKGQVYFVNKFKKVS